MRLLFAFGTRPEAIKMAPVIRAARDRETFLVRTCVTGQHRDLLDPVLRFFEISPEFDLDVMSAGQGLFEITSRVLFGMRGVLETCKPDFVVVHGDTTTTFAVTLAAFYLGLDVAHVEAGLRTGNLKSPFPEEANRALTSRLARLHFAPTEGNRQNLLREGTLAESIFVTGNTVIDALLYTRDRVHKGPTNRYDACLGGFRERFLSFGRSVLVTAHRRETFGAGMKAICSAVRRLADGFPEVAFLFPVHPNPEVRSTVSGQLSNVRNVFLAEPMKYESFVYFMDRSELVLTDSGGIQEEAPVLGKPVFVMRDLTERGEALEARTVALVGTDPERIWNAVAGQLTGEHSWDPGPNPYGDGHASSRILDAIESELKSQ